MSVLVLDDRDKSIAYSAGWAEAGSPNEFDSTITWTINAGSTAKLAFTGTSVGVYGTIIGKTVAAAPVSTYSIDGGAPKIFTANQGANPQFHQLFYQSPALTNAQHVLTITYPTLSAPFVLDFFMITQAQANTPTTINSTSLSSSTTSSLTSTSASASITANSTSTSTSSISSTSSTSSIITSSSSQIQTPVTVTVTSVASTPTGDADAANATGNSTSVNSAQGASKSNTSAIVGGILGGIVALVLIVFAIIIWRRRRQDKRSSVISSNFWNIHTDNSGPIVPSPFGQESSRPPSPGVSSAPAMTQTPMSAPYPASASYGATSAAYQQPRYPGGYAPAPVHQAAAYRTYPAYGNSAYAPGTEQAYAADAYYDQPYGGNAYTPPSQLMNSNYGR